MTTNGDTRVEFVDDDVLVDRRIVGGHLKSKAVHPTPPVVVHTSSPFCSFVVIPHRRSTKSGGGGGRGGMGLGVLDQRCRGITCIE
jgi:hypothetical protein